MSSTVKSQLFKFLMFDEKDIVALNIFYPLYRKKTRERISKNRSMKKVLMLIMMQVMFKGKRSAIN